MVAPIGGMGAAIKGMAVANEGMGAAIKEVGAAILEWQRPLWGWRQPLKAWRRPLRSKCKHYRIRKLKHERYSRIPPESPTTVVLWGKQSITGAEEHQSIMGWIRSLIGSQSITGWIQSIMG